MLITTKYGVVLNISIHPPRAGRDALRMAGGNLVFEFQSALPVRRGTTKENQQAEDAQISIHPLRAERDHLNHR